MQILCKRAQREYTLICRVQLSIMQILCKRAQREYTLSLPSAAKYYANTLQTSAKRVYSQFAECS